MIKLIYIAEVRAIQLSSEYFPEISEKQQEELNDRVRFFIESGYYEDFENIALNIWYAVTKLHLLINGNKRMGFACFLSYCSAENKKPVLSGDAAKEISSEIARSNSAEKQELIQSLRQQLTFRDIGSEGLER